jgi:putative phosphonate metabolism protein
MRYAIYYAPRETETLHDLASQWLGRDVLRGANREQPIPIPGIALGELTQEPRRYGFHATLKPPFALAASATATALLLAVHALARRFAPVPVPGLRITWLNDFFALTALGDQQAVNELAAGCVADLDSFRAPPTLAELTRRRTATLSERQERLLHRWGYPYVMEDYRFHMTLTGKTDAATAAAVEPALAAHFAPVLNTPLVIDALSVFVEPAPDEPFVFLSRVPLEGGHRWSASQALAAS